jgi:hypothetical protein
MDLTQEFTMTMQQLTIYTLIAELLLAIPLGMILKRVGLSPFWTLLSFIPALGVPALWLLAFIRWPRDAQPQP